MVDPSSIPSALPERSRRFIIWFNALVGIVFIAVMVLPLEASAAWISGAFLHSATIGWIVAAVTLLPTLFWLFGRGLSQAVSAEAEILDEVRRPD
ncbi:hypothetical protein DLJ53_01915 [Acuticoccus sediminis]|uniref:DUF485 domain-containing protein n=1 Tax=Acuticoccus sediminis TaxID=2184697 RepID=A0A8B2NXA3_9HYPH|nr:hypothetical protein [Acuticoccus sediminis]RAI03300.1 hypothetical protein DLJ53_01915 [Acuticoccus sediminis]